MSLNGAPARHSDGPVVPRIVQPVALEPEGSQPLSVIVASLPAIDPTEHALTRQHRLEVLLDPRPGPVGNSGDAIAGPGLRASGPHFSRAPIDVGIHQTQDRSDLETGAVGQREDRTVGRGSAFDDSPHIRELQEAAAGPGRRWRRDLTDRIRSQNADLDQVAAERLHRS